MKKTIVLLCSVILIIYPALSQETFTPSSELDSLVANLVKKTQDRFRKEGLKDDQIAVVLVSLNKPTKPIYGSYQAQRPFYAASLVKLFFLRYGQELERQGKLKSTPELQSAARDMIRLSSNTATGYYVDQVTGTKGGPVLSEKVDPVWLKKRQAVNEYYKKQGYQNINVIHKTADCPDKNLESKVLGKNQITAYATALVLYELLQEPANSALLLRDLKSKSYDPDDQATAFLGKNLPEGSSYWSKAGWTDAVRHDAAKIKLPTGSEYILVVLTEGNSKLTELIPYLGQELVAQLAKPSPYRP
ncbi:MAG: serine hydrolase [Candidatus Caenarcaniphilales bacterium]|nr:serine hydrolase [Candidatus Caenarcaniphilales bacterium]